MFLTPLSLRHFFLLSLLPPLCPRFPSLCPSLVLSSSLGSPGSQSLYVWLAQWHLLYAALPAFGSGENTTANPSEQCQARVSVCTCNVQALPICMNMQKKTHTHYTALHISPACHQTHVPFFPPLDFYSRTQHALQAQSDTEKDTQHVRATFAGSSSLNLPLV